MHGHGHDLAASRKGSREQCNCRDIRHARISTIFISTLVYPDHYLKVFVGADPKFALCLGGRGGYLAAKAATPVDGKSPHGGVAELLRGDPHSDNAPTEVLQLTNTMQAAILRLYHCSRYISMRIITLCMSRETRSSIETMTNGGG